MRFGFNQKTDKPDKPKPSPAQKKNTAQVTPSPAQKKNTAQVTPSAHVTRSTQRAEYIPEPLSAQVTRSAQVTPNAQGQNAAQVTPNAQGQNAAQVTPNAQGQNAAQVTRSAQVTPNAQGQNAAQVTPNGNPSPPRPTRASGNEDPRGVNGNDVDNANFVGSGNNNVNQSIMEGHTFPKGFKPLVFIDKRTNNQVVGAKPGEKGSRGLPGTFFGVGFMAAGLAARTGAEAVRAGGEVYKDVERPLESN